MTGSTLWWKNRRRAGAAQKSFKGFRRKETKQLEPKRFTTEQVLLAHRMGVRGSNRANAGANKSEVSNGLWHGDDNDTRLLNVIPDAGREYGRTRTADTQGMARLCT